MGDTILSAEARKQVTEAFESALTMWKRTDMPRKLDDALTWVENDQLANARIEAALALLASLPEAPAVEAKPSVQGLAEHLRTHAKFLDEADFAIAATMHRSWASAVESLEASRIAPEGQADPFQSRVQPWMMACFGPEISRDTVERNHRFLEESLELVRSLGCTQSEAHQLVDYVFGRLLGEPEQEAGGVMVTLAALCLAQGLDMHEAGETELARIWTKVDVIRAKQAAKPKHSPLPGPSHTCPDSPGICECVPRCAIKGETP